MKKRINKRWFILVLIIMLVLTIGMIFYGYIKVRDKQTVNTIREHYSTKVIMINNTKLYNKDLKSVGSISKDMVLELEPVIIDKPSKLYFEIKDTDYYVFYKDIMPSTLELLKMKDYYIPLSLSIKANDLSFYKESKEVLKLNDYISINIVYQDANYYYTDLFGQILGLKKDKSLNIIEVPSTEMGALTVPVIYFDNINNDKLIEKLEYLKANKYYTIDANEYLEWKSSNIKLKNNVVLLLASFEDKAKGINKNTFNLKQDNQVSTKENTIISNYKVKDNTGIEDYKNMLSGKKIEVLPPITPPNKEQKIPVLNYHFFYNPEGGEVCGESICLSVRKFEEQLKYLSDNGYKTLTIEEFKSWMYKEIELPKKSVLITVDDGAMGTGKHNGNKLIPLLEKYNLHATLFLITGWWDIENYRSPNLDIQSHTNDMHKGVSCKDKPRGPQMLCLSKEQVIKDLKQSIAITKSSTSFCYPFYAYDQSAINNVREVGFKLAFAGGNKKASRTSSKYAIPRYTIYDSITIKEFISKIN